jgi:flagellar FliL protein
MSETAKNAAPAAEKKKLNLMPIMMGVVIVLVLAIGAKVFLGGFKASAKAAVKPKVEVGVALALDEFLVNLNGSSDHYLKTTIALGLKKGLTEEGVKEHIPAMKDAVLSVLQNKSMKELNSPKERDALKDEIKEQVNKEIGEEPVVKVYFTAFATQ